MIKCNYLIIGSGIIGLTIALELKQRFPESHIIIIEKEDDVAKHASGLNSGVLHTGFYYSSDSLKAKFCREGNQLMRQFCINNNIRINECGKIVVAKDEADLESLELLYERGKINNINVELIDEDQLTLLDSNIRTFKKALYSPNTASVDPREVCQKIKDILKAKGVEFYFKTSFESQKESIIYTNKLKFKPDYIVNAAGLYTDKIAQNFGFGKNYAMLPFKGRYIKSINNINLGMHVYPVPDLNIPFLGIHYTISSNQTVKIGPSSIPALWREHYSGVNKFNLSELVETIRYLCLMWVKNANSIRKLILSEIKKLSKSNFIGQVKYMTHHDFSSNFKKWTKPGIRAQLIQKDSAELVMDFVIEGDHHSIHLLNTISPGFTCAFPIAKYTVDLIAKYRNIN